MGFTLKDKLILILMFLFSGCLTVQEEDDDSEKANTARMLYSQCMNELNACKQQQLLKGRGPR